MHSEVISPIVQIVLSKGNGTSLRVHDLTNYIEISFSNITIKDDTVDYECVYFDEISHDWSSDGMSSQYDSRTLTMKCLTSHLTSFAVIDLNFKKAVNNQPKPNTPPSFSIKKDANGNVDATAAIAATVSILGSVLVCGIIISISIAIVAVAMRSRKSHV
ncbi:hypothetical protein C9374_007585 [Naegleria lovaniensis]|uniref:GAIN-B domain-containing protein n=1 Tax=Naegleria lovaniensis TaxID=51637 RepID=A0AA88GKA6_NAELO|nr:uncharacterized protein C9374_007585 [Naegleria lovaniensis]KAG2378947.1 hypothetical protein C9374_007585 [Naegleria lovaniensis]